MEVGRDEVESLDLYIGPLHFRKKNVVAGSWVGLKGVDSVLGGGGFSFLTEKIKPSIRW